MGNRRQGQMRIRDRTWTADSQKGKFSRQKVKEHPSGVGPGAEAGVTVVAGPWLGAEPEKI